MVARRTKWRKMTPEQRRRIIDALKADTSELMQRNKAKELTSAERTEEISTTGTTDTEVVAEG